MCSSVLSPVPDDLLIFRMVMEMQIHKTAFISESLTVYSSNFWWEWYWVPGRTQEYYVYDPSYFQQVGSIVEKMEPIILKLHFFSEPCA